MEPARELVRRPAERKRRHTIVAFRLRSSMKRRPLLALVLALALLSGIHRADVHDLHHALDVASREAPAPLNNDCPDHALFAPFAGYIGASDFAQQCAVAKPAVAIAASRAAISLPLRYAFLARAPPAIPRMT
jgi:hypothetical protein